ncbi:MAG TPA: BamA/TamA family outer membrane protein [Chitinophaga sp.]
MQKLLALFWASFIFYLPTYAQSQTDTLTAAKAGADVSRPAVKDKKARSLLAFPVATHSIETNWSFGAALSYTFHISKDTATRTSNMQALFLYSLKKQLVTALNGSVYFPKEKYILNYLGSYSYFPDNFWGLGKNTPDAAKTSYTFQQYFAFLHLMRNLGHNLFLGVMYEQQNLLKIKHTPGDLLDQEMVTGRNGYLISGAGLSVTFDNRNNAFAPDKGYFAQAFFNHFDKAFGSDYNYTNVVIDLRLFKKIYHDQVLAVQAYDFSNFGTVPLRSLASFGGSNSMRGYYDGRYRDNNQLVLQAEYRVPVIGRFGAVGFAGVGDVAHTVVDYALNSLKYSFGGGLRFALDKKEKLNLRVDYGIAQGNNNGLYFQLGEAF